MNHYDPRTALRDVEETEARLADKVAPCPPWRHAVFGALFFALIGSIAISSQVQFMTMPFILIGVVLILRSDRKRHGVFINGYRRGRTLRVTLGFVGLMIVLVSAAMHMRSHDFSIVTKFALAATAFALAIGFSRKWNEVFQQELRQHA